MSATGKFALLATVLVLGSLMAACSTPEGNIADGERWFKMHNCSGCHGPHGNDGRAPEVWPLEMGFGSFEKKLRVTDAPIMPAFPEEKLSSSDAADIYAYLTRKE